MAATVDSDARERPRFSRDHLLYAGVAILAFIARLTPVLIGGGLRSYGRYDDGVYYTAADALTFGRVPYRDFVLLHPPGIMVVLAPFALLGRLTSDPIGLAVARLAFMGVGAANAVLVTVLARRWGIRAAVVAGVLYACWYPAVYGEQATLLEPLGGTALLVALLLLLKTKAPPTPRAEIVAGVVLGLACVMKIWYAAPMFVVIVWQLLARRGWSTLRIFGAGVAAAFVVILPFFVLAPSRMWDMVIRDQLLRHQAATSRGIRLQSITGVKRIFAPYHVSLTAVTGVVLAILIVAAIVCIIDRHARVLVALLAANMLVLLMTPTYFGHYAALIAAPAALVVGVALARLVGLLPTYASAGVVGVALALFLASGIRIMTLPEEKAFPAARFQAGAPPGCVAADDPGALILMNRLSSDLREGCRMPVDVSGITYDTLERVNAQGKTVSRAKNHAWQQYIYDYLVSGHTFIIARRGNDRLDAGIASALQGHQVVVQGKKLELQLGDAPPPSSGSAAQ